MAGNLNAGIVTAQSITDGTNSATPELLAKGTAKAWVNFNGTGVVAIRASYNVSSITDNGVGDYTVNFITFMPDANYGISGFCNLQGSVSPAGVVTYGNDFNPLTNNLRIKAANTTTGGVQDAAHVSVSIFR